MSVRVRDFLNNIEIEPINRRDFALIIDYRNNIVVEETDINELRLGRGQQGDASDAVQIVKNWGNIAEPIPYRKEIEINGTNYVVFDGFLDGLSATYTPEEITAKVYQFNSLEQLQRLASGTTFEFLYNTNSSLNPSDNIYIPYVRRDVPVSLEFFIMGFSLFVMTMQLLEQVANLQKDLADIAGVLNSAAGVVKFTLTIIFILTLTLAIIQILIDLFNLIIQPVKYHATMRAFTQLQKAFFDAGFDFKSSILEGLYKDLCILPQKQKVQDPTIITELNGLLDPFGSEEKGFYKGTVQQLLEQMYILFNAKLFIQGNTVRLERRDYKPSAPRYRLNQIEHEERSFNFDDWTADWAFNFAVDVNDKNTIQKYAGTSINVIRDVEGINDFTILRGAQPVSISSEFALLKRKTQQYPMEAIYATFYDTLNSIQNTISSLGGGALPPAENPIRARLFMAELANDDVQVPRLFILQEGASPTQNRISNLNDTLLSADFIYENFYKIDSFAPQNGQVGNQFERKKIEKDNFDAIDYLNIKNNAYIYDQNGDEAELEMLKFFIDEEVAEIEYKRKKEYIKQVSERKLEINGR
jgi:hypothetical protein